MQGLLDNFTYDKVTGVIKNRWGREVGSKTKKYVRIFYDGKEIQAHRLAVLLVTGEWPKEEVDHINRDGHDNRWDNLRECSRTQNFANKGIYKSNTSGFKGVYPKNGRFDCSIQNNKKRVFLGSFNTAEEAARAYDAAARIFHKEFASLNYGE